MKTDTKVLTMSVRSITFGALTIAMIVAFFTFFKGATNILNAFFVPITLYSFSINRKVLELLIVSVGAIAICALFFNLQLIFIVFYCVIALILSILNRENAGIAVSAITLSAAVTLFFWIAIILTDSLFKTRMSEIMLKLMNGNRVYYTLLLTFEGTVVGISQLFASRLILKKLRAFERD